MKSQATTVDAYLAGLPADRRTAIAAVRDVILKNLPPGFVECMAYGMIGYVVPLARFPKTYNGQPLMIASLGSQKNHMAVYLMAIYGDTKLRAWFEQAFAAAGKKLDAGKACVRFSRLEQLPLAVIGQAIARVSVECLIGWHEKAQAARPHKRVAKAKALSKPAKKPAKSSK